MKIEKIEETLKEIREREDYLVRLRSGEEMDVCYYYSSGILMMGGSRYSQLFTLSKKEKDFLKSSCITEIKRLKKSIECLTD